MSIGFGAAYGTAKSGVGIASMGVLRPDLIIKNVVPVIMAGIIGIYGLVVAVLVSDGCKSPPKALFVPAQLLSWIVTDEQWRRCSRCILDLSNLVQG